MATSGTVSRTSRQRPSVSFGYFMIGGVSHMENIRSQSQGFEQYERFQDRRHAVQRFRTEPACQKNLREVIVGLHKIEPNLLSYHWFSKRGQSRASKSAIRRPHVSECIDDIAVVPFPCGRRTTIKAGPDAVSPRADMYFEEQAFRRSARGSVRLAILDENCRNL